MQKVFWSRWKFTPVSIFSRKLDRTTSFISLIYIYLRNIPSDALGYVRVRSWMLHQTLHQGSISFDHRNPNGLHESVLGAYRFNIFEYLPRPTMIIRSLSFSNPASLILMENVNLLHHSIKIDSTWQFDEYPSRAVDSQ